MLKNLMTKMFGFYLILEEKQVVRYADIKE
jgi:hypothetical protein